MATFLKKHSIPYFTPPWHGAVCLICGLTLWNPCTVSADPFTWPFTLTDMLLHDNKAEGGTAPQIISMLVLYSISKLSMLVYGGHGGMWMWGVSVECGCGHVCVRKNNINILKQIVWETQKFALNFRRQAWERHLTKKAGNLVKAALNIPKRKENA